MQNLLLILVVVFPALCAALCWFVPALRPDKARDGFVLVSLIVTLALVIGLCTTGDGMMSAIALLNVVADTKQPLSKLADEIPQFPQVLVNVIVDNDKKAKAVEDPELIAAKEAIEAEMNGDGRVLLRLSGTEPLVRIMLEGKDEKDILDKALTMARIVVKNHGGKIKA